MKTKKTNRLATFIIVVVTALFLLLAFSITSNAHEPFAGKTKHKTVKKMKKHHIKKAQKGKTYYYREHGKLKKQR